MTRARVGIAVSGMATIFLLFDAVVHIANIDVVQTAMAELGYRDGVAPILGVIELCCIGLYLWRRTALLGAVVLTGYLGGAVASNLRIDKPLVSTVLFPVYVAAAAWVGLYLRDRTLRSLINQTLTPPTAVASQTVTHCVTRNEAMT